MVIKYLCYAAISCKKAALRMRSSSNLRTSFSNMVTNSISIALSIAVASVVWVVVVTVFMCCSFSYTTTYKNYAKLINIV